jgi:uncharacterized lipoprotein YddW (UPF0748 family)
MLALAALVGLAAAPPSSPSEMRGLWLVRTGLVSPEAVDRTVDEAARAGFNALFAQVRGRCDAFYRSAFSPRSLLLDGQPGTFDPLARLLERAHARGLQVHAWVNVLLCAPHAQPVPAGHVLRRRPDFAMAARALGRPTEAEGVYLSPSAPGVPPHLEAVVRELVRDYAVDGLHLDFIRYPGPEFDYSAAALEGFARSQRLLGGPVSPQADPPAWARYRRDVLTALTARLTRAARAERPGLVVSAAVVPDEAQAVHHRYQDWPAWAAQGLLDAICPMAYTSDRRVFRWQLVNAVSRARRGLAVWAGIGAYRLSLAGVVGHVQEARAVGAAGVVLFSHESLLPTDAERLRADAFGPPPAPVAGGGASAPGEASQR